MVGRITISAPLAAFVCVVCLLGTVCAQESALDVPLTEASPAPAEPSPTLTGSDVAAAAAAAAPEQNRPCPPGSLGPARASIRYMPNNRTNLCLTAIGRQLIVATCTGRHNQVFTIKGATSPTCDLYMKVVTFEYTHRAAVTSGPPRVSCIGLPFKLQDAQPGASLQLQDCSAALQFGWNYPSLSTTFEFLAYPYGISMLAMDVARGSSRRLQLSRMTEVDKVWGLVAA